MSKYKIPLLVHCELDDDSKNNQSVDFEKNPTSYQGWLESRPKAWENEAVRLMIRLCRKFRCRVHIVHLSSAEVLEEIIQAKKEGLPITVETCPHYLFFDAETFPMVIPDSNVRRRFGKNRIIKF